MLEKPVKEEGTAQDEKPIVVPIGQDASDFELMADSVSDYAIILLDATGHVARWNPGAERFKGYKSEEILGQHFSRFYPEEAVKSGFPDHELEQAVLVGRFEDEGWRLRKDGTRFWANVIITALRDKNGEVRGFAKLTRDLTERRLAEENLRNSYDELEERVQSRTAELARLNTELKAAKEAAEQANQAKSEFLSRMSHELRTPLNSILGFAQLLDMQELDSLGQESVDYILKAGDHLLNLINEVLDIARIESGRMDLSIEPVMVGVVVREAVGLVQSLAIRNAVTLDASDVTCDQLYAMADHQRLKQVLINLLSNAVKYNKTGGKVEVSCQVTEANMARIAVRDTGLGINPESLSKLFVPFERLDAVKTTIEGTGLGLALSKKIIEAMGGTIEAESVVGQGSTFAVELPLADCRLLEVQGLDELQAAEAAPDAKSFTVLYIEDNTANYRLIEAILSYRPGAVLLGAMQGSMGLDLAQRHAPDIILLDLHLPDMKGFDVLYRLRESETTSHIPIIVISADATPRQIQRLLSAGADSYITKPIKVKEFLRALDEMLEKRNP